jgi:MerR HTH family regulatory protein
MARMQDVAPSGFFTLTDAARITGVDRGRVNYWCSRWGARLINPEVDPRTRGGTKLLSEHDLVKVALIPKLLQTGLVHAQIAHMFSKAEPAWWDLSKAKRDNPNFLDWIVVVRDWRFRLEWRLVASAYRHGPPMQVGGGPLEGLRDVLNDALRKHGPMRGFQVIELSNLKRDLLERIE